MRIEASNDERAQAGRPEIRRKGTKLGDLLSHYQTNGRRFPFELTAFIGLEVAEAMMKEARRCGPSEVEIDQDGAVRVAPSDGSSEAVCAEEIATLLRSFLSLAGTEIPGSLTALADATRTPVPLGAMRDELEATLVPLNRAASRRVLARSIREVVVLPTGVEATPVAPQPVAASHSLPPIEPTRAAAEQSVAPLDIVSSAAAVMAAPVRAPRLAVTAPPAPEENIDTSPGHVPAGMEGGHPLPRLSLGALGAAKGNATLPMFRVDTSPGEIASDVVVEVEGLVDEGVPSVRIPSLAPVSVPNVDSRTGGGLGRLFGLSAMTVGIALGATAIWAQGGLNQAYQSFAARLSSLQAPPTGTLSVTFDEQPAAVWLFVGRGPVVASALRTQTSHRFAAFSGENLAVGEVARTARYHDGRYELALQPASDLPIEGFFAELEKDSSFAPAARPTSELAEVRVVTNPPGAKVFRFMGYGRRVMIANVPVDAGAELLLWSKSGDKRRVLVGPSDWDHIGDTYTASVDVR